MKNEIINSKNIKQTMGARLKEAREKRKLSRAEFCDLLQKKRAHMEDISEENVPLLQESTYKQWELGKNQINLEWVPAIHEVLGCDIDYLFGYSLLETKAATDINAVTGLSTDSILSLQELSRLNKSAKEAVFKFLDDLLDSDPYFSEIAIAYKKYIDKSYKKGEYFIVDSAGQFVDLAEGDISIMILQNAFNRFLHMQQYNAITSRAAMRCQWGNLSDVEREEILIQGKIDRQLGK